jgi:hypothetical protein
MLMTSGSIPGWGTRKLISKQLIGLDLGAQVTISALFRKNNIRLAIIIVRLPDEGPSLKTSKSGNTKIQKQIHIINQRPQKMQSKRHFYGGKGHFAPGKRALLRSWAPPPTSQKCPSQKCPRTCPLCPHPFLRHWQGVYAIFHDKAKTY